MDTLGGFKVGDKVRCRDTDPGDGDAFWGSFKRGVIGTVDRIHAGGTGDGGREPAPGTYYPRWDYLVVGGNFYRPHWLTKIEDAPKAVEKPCKPFTSVYDYSDYFTSPFKTLYTRDPERATPFAPKVSEHDELLTLRAERDSERRWAAHWKGVADKREDEFKRATEAEVAAAALADTVEAQDEEIKALKTENRALKLCRDDWINEAASSKKIARDSRLDEAEAVEARDRALSVRNFALAISSAVVGSAGYVLYSCWGLI